MAASLRSSPALTGLRGRAWKRIVFKRSGLNVVPYIKITATGRAAYAVMDAESDTPIVRRALVIRINNAEIEYMDTPGRFTTPTASDPAGAGAAAAADGSRMQQQ